MYNIITTSRIFFYGCLSVIISIYLLIIVILCYVGPINTIKVKHGLKKHPVDAVVSLTTTPYRIDTIKPVLDSIVRQSINPTKIYVNIPWRFKRNNTEYIIPAWLKDYPNIYSNIIINRTEDYGPATKLLGALITEHDPNAIIITIDDDKIYPRHLVRDFIQQYLFNKINNTVITVLGVNFLFGPYFNFSVESIIEKHTPSLTILGIGGVAYRRKFFKDDIFELTNNLPTTCFLSDDLMIAAYLYDHNINILTTSSNYYNRFSLPLLLQALPSSFTKDALTYGGGGIGAGSNEANYTDCLASLPKYNKIRYQQVMLHKSQEINGLLQKNRINIAVKQLGYNYLDYLINKMPLVKKMIIAIIG